MFHSMDTNRNGKLRYSWAVDLEAVRQVKRSDKEGTGSILLSLASAHRDRLSF